MKSVKDISDETGVSVQTVYRRLDKVKQKTDETLTEKIDGVTYFTEIGEKLILEAINKVKQSSTTVKQSESDEILFLREQITAMNTEKVKLLEQIDKLNDFIMSAFIL